MKNSSTISINPNPAFLLLASSRAHQKTELFPKRGQREVSRCPERRPAWIGGASLATLLVAIFVSNAKAQTDPTFLELQSRNLVQWSAADRAWLLNEAESDIQFRGRELVVKDRFFSRGKPISIIAETLDINPTGLVSSGFPRAADNGANPGEHGKSGLRAGDIEVIAKTVRGVKISADGQVGGSGAKGREGLPGYDSSVASEDGGNAWCDFNQAWESGRGGSRGVDGVRESSRGGDAGNGYKGGNAGPGGAPGNITISYAEANVDILRSGISAKTGTHGVAGAGGEPGRQGQPGPRGNMGARAECKCRCECTGNTRRRGDSCHPRFRDDTNVDYEPLCGSCFIDGGDPGPLGGLGDPGRRGDSGDSVGLPTAVGKIAIQAMAPDAIDVILSANIPSSGAALLKKAERLHFLNRFDEALAALAELTPPLNLPAAELKARLSCGLSYFGQPMDFASVKFDNADTSPHPISVDKGLNELQDVRRSLEYAEHMREYRKKQLVDAQQAQRAHESELSALDYERSREISYQSESDAAKKYLEDVVLEQLNDLKSHVNRSLDETERDLRSAYGNVFEEVGAISDAVSRGIGAIGNAALAFHSGSPIAGGLSLLSGLSAFGEASDRSNELFNKLLQQNADETRHRLEERVRDLKERIGMMQSKVNDATKEQLQHAIRSSGAEKRLALIESRRARVQALRNAIKPEELRELSEIAQVIYDQQATVAFGLLDDARRYRDLRLNQTSARVPLVLPPGGLEDVFSVRHFDMLLLRERARTDALPQVRIERFVIDRKDEGVQEANFFDSLNTELRRMPGDLVRPPLVLAFPIKKLISVAPHLQDSRIRKLKIELSNANGKPAVTRFALAHRGNTGGASVRRPTYMLNPVHVWMFPDSNSQPEAAFWFRTLEDLFEWSMPSSSDSIESIAIEVELELAAPNLGATFPIQLLGSPAHRDRCMNALIALN